VPWNNVRNSDGSTPSRIWLGKTEMRSITPVFQGQQTPGDGLDSIHSEDYSTSLKSWRLQERQPNGKSRMTRGPSGQR
jgi:hypothetical protein